MPAGEPVAIAEHIQALRAHRAMGYDVVLVDPFGITGALAHGLNWLDMLNPDDPDVVSQAGPPNAAPWRRSGASSPPSRMTWPMPWRC